MKKFLIPIFVFLVLIFFYVYFENSKGAGSAALVPRDPSSNQANIGVGAEIILLLQKLDRITLDTSLFDEQTFQSLKDFSITLRPQSVGRPNPFAPIGTDTTSSAPRAQSTQGNTVPAPEESFSTSEELDSTGEIPMDEDEALLLLEEEQ